MKILFALAALLAVGGFALLEWRRADRRHLAARLGATVLAVAALALWGWRPTWPRPAAAPPAGGELAALWTAGAAAGDGVAAPAVRRQFALPDAAAAPADAVVLPDAAILRRRFPGVGTLHVYGDGLEPSDAGALYGLHVVFHAPTARTPAPVFTFMRCPRVVAIGEPLTVQGRVSGLRPGGVAPVALEAPDGIVASASTAPANADGDAGFSVTGAPPPAAGRFEWRLRLGKNDGETLGVAVAAPRLPRVLALAGAPRFDVAALRRWFEAAGGTFVARTLVGQDRYRFESAHAPPPQFNAVDAALLGGFDLVLADGRALAALPPPERDALRAAVADMGLGVLVLADEATAPDAPGVSPEARAAFFPWKLTAPGGAADGPESEQRLARVQWPGQTFPAEIPLPVAPFEIAPQPDQTPLMHDSQGRTLAASLARGRGRVALTLVRETGRWTRANDPAAFAAYWSELFSSLARRTTAADGGRWVLAGGDAGPVFTDQPLELIWLGKTPPAPASGVVTAGADADPRPINLALASGPVDGHWRGTFWPREPGWHRVSMPSASGAADALDFYVHPAGNWPALDAARRRAATARLAEESGISPDRGPATASVETTPVPAGWWFVVFLAAAGYLWAERRLLNDRPLQDASYP